MQQAGKAVGAQPGQGPSGFITIDQNHLLVDHGKIVGFDGSPIGFFYEDGLIEGKAPPLNGFKGLKTIEEFAGANFKGIDSRGYALELPTEKRGPTGALKYNEVALTVIYGRVSTADHRVVGMMEDDGTLYLRDHKTPSVLHKMDEVTQLQTVFTGIKSTGAPLLIDWIRPLHRKGRTYVENEIIRYFLDYDKLTMIEKQYVTDTMRLWAASGLLQVVRKSEGDCALGNVKHGASGVTGVRTGKVTLDKEEFAQEIKLYREAGPIAPMRTRVHPYLEVRINLVVSHEFGHQLEFASSQSVIDKVTDIYGQKVATSSRLHPRPEGYEGGSEVVLPQQLEQRVFISGYSRASMHEFWAESVAAFSVKSSRAVLKQTDPPIFQLLTDMIYSPEKTLSLKFEQDFLKLQTSLRVGGELTDDLLDKC